MIISELQTLFKNFLNEKPHLFLKTSTSEKGKGAFSVDYDKEHNQYYLNDKPSDLRIIQETLDSVGQDFLVQQRLIQHKELNRLYPHSLNTIRVVSVIENNEVYIINALLRCGTDGRVVDNASQGGVFVGINDDGTLMQYGYYYPEFGTKTDEHPDTKVAFASITIPYYKEVLNLVKEAHHAFNRTKTVGWDVAVLEDGPILIEGNSCWAERIVQICCGGIKKKMDKYLKQ